MKKYITKTLNGMAYGLFATLIIGVIFQQFGKLTNIDFIKNDLYSLLASLMGVGIGIGIGLVLEKQGLSLVLAAVIGAISTKFSLVHNPLEIKIVTGPGNPLTAYFVTVFSIVIIENILKKKTPVDIIVVPLVSIIVAVILTLVLSLPLNLLNGIIERSIDSATNAVPFLMVIIISVTMGMILTAPISSAAIAVAINLGANPIAAGAAVVGTSIQMIGFAIQSRRDNDLGTVISVGVGTSMLQFENIVKTPVIWLPTILASAIVAPITWALGFESTTAGAGMGTSGLVGFLQSLDKMGYNNWKVYVSLLIITFFGGLLVYIFDKIMYTKGWIKDGDLKISKALQKEQE